MDWPGVFMPPLPPRPLLGLPFWLQFCHWIDFMASYIPSADNGSSGFLSSTSPCAKWHFWLSKQLPWVSKWRHLSVLYFWLSSFFLWLLICGICCCYPPWFPGIMFWNWFMGFYCCYCMGALLTGCCWYYPYFFCILLGAPPGVIYC